MFFLLISCGLEINKQTFLVKKKKRSRFLSEMSHPPLLNMVIILSLSRVCSDLGPCFHTAQPDGSAENSVRGYQEFMEQGNCLLIMLRCT